MPLNLASPGIVVREVDLTTGRVDPTSDKVGALVSPFAKGPVEVPVLITNEQELLANFGNPYSTDKHYENWLVASSFLAYGGSLRVIRSDDNNLKNSYVGSATTGPKIKSYEDYVNLGYDENVISGITFAARTPGSWANGIKVAIIDGKADQILSGIVTTSLQVGMGITQSVSGRVNPGAAGTSVLTGYLKGVVTEIGSSNISVKVISHVSDNATETNVDYQEGGIFAFSSTGNVAIHTAGSTTSFASTSYTSTLDWFGNQRIQLSNSSVRWNSLAERPGTSNYAAARNSRFDEVHVVVFDELGTITGNTGTILEKHLNLSKASDAEYSAGNPSYWRKYISENSTYIFAGEQPAGITTTGFSSGFTLQSDLDWDQSASGVIFGGTGSKSLSLGGGTNYDNGTDLSATGALSAELDKLSAGYDLVSNTEEYTVDFLLMGSAAYPKEISQSLASKLISVAEIRKDAIAFISPNRASLLTETGENQFVVKNPTSITDNVISFYSSVPSSSYAVFDSGYKYMYDRFNGTFRYVPLNGDIAGICARNDVTNFAWVSPAGTSKGSVLNAVKLAYNPNNAQRDRLYSARINPVIFSPGSGIILFGDKTGLGKASAFDRINVRRLFIYIEKIIAESAKNVMFEFNDSVTRNAFVSTVEPFLRDIQSKRGIEDFRVVCDQTNNTASIIDNNEFIADIYVKPNRSINFIGLTFVATRSGISFEEIIGNV